MEPLWNNEGQQIVELFKRIQKRFRHRIMHAPEMKNITVPQMMLLHVLAEHPGLSLTELSEKLQLAKSTVSGIVDRLVERQMVRREIPEENRRITRHYLTAQTDGAQCAALDAGRIYASEVLSHATAAEIETVLTGLRVLDKLMDDETGKHK